MQAFFLTSSHSTAFLSTSISKFVCTSFGSRSPFGALANDIAAASKPLFANAIEDEA
jgi:hypothetical protein